jgi:hypothetical protein
VKEVSGSPRANEGPDEHAPDENNPVGTPGNTPEPGHQRHTLRFPGKPRFPPRSDSAESIDNPPGSSLLKDRHL